jgi:hypothetical protein
VAASKKASKELTSNSEAWRISDWPGLASDLTVQEHQFEAFMDCANIAGEGPYAAIRMRYGINPVIPNPNVNGDFLRKHTLAEVAVEFGTTVEGIKEWIVDFRNDWEKVLPGLPDKGEKPAVVTPTRSKKITDSQLETLAAFRFPPQIFSITDFKRSDETIASEINWFCERLHALTKVFEHPTACDFGRQLVMTEMNIRRVDDQLIMINPLSDRFDGISEKKSRMSKTMMELWKKIEEFVPQIAAHAKKSQLAGVVSDFTAGYLEFYADGENKIIDGLFTNFEIQVECRDARQFAMSRHRPGFVAAVNEAKRGLFDPQFRRKISNKQLRLLDQVWRNTELAIREANPDKVVDLEADGPKGEFPPIFIDEDGSPEGNIEIND